MEGLSSLKGYLFFGSFSTGTMMKENSNNIKEKKISEQSKK
jgi:hypothetical protein